MTKEEMEAVWRSPDLQCRSNRTVWRETGPEPGEPLRPKNGKSAEAVAKRCLTHSLPAWPGYADGSLYISKEMRARYKERFPRNYKELLSAYGKTKTKFDDLREFSRGVEAGD